MEKKSKLEGEIPDYGWFDDLHEPEEEKKMFLFGKGLKSRDPAVPVGLGCGDVDVDGWPLDVVVLRVNESGEKEYRVYRQAAWLDSGAVLGAGDDEESE